MAATGRPAEPTLRELLFQEPYRFNFFQAVRLLQALSQHRDRVGEPNGRPEREAVRFRAVTSLAFAPAAIAHLVEPPESGGPAEMSVAFFGMIGPSGVLPVHYTHLTCLQSERGDHTLRDFLDWFHHRLLSLFYRAWESRRLFMSFENSLSAADWNQCADGPRSTSGDDLHKEGPCERALYGLIGLGMSSLRGRMALPDLNLLRYAGFLVQRPRSAMALQLLLCDYFGVPIEVQQFQGQYVTLAASNRCCLGSRGTLGMSTVIGDRVWLPQAMFRLRLGPMIFAEYVRFLPKHPNGKVNVAFVRLVQLTQMFVGPELDFDIQLVLRGDAVPRCELGKKNGDYAAQLGQSTWLFSTFTREQAEESIFPGHLRGLLP